MLVGSLRRSSINRKFAESAGRICGNIGLNPYCGILIARLQRDSAALRVKAAEEDLGDSQRAVESGSALEVSAMSKRVAKLEDEQTLLAAENRISDLTVELNSVMGLPLDTEFDLAPPEVDTTFALTVAESTQAGDGTGGSVGAFTRRTWP